MIFWIDMFSLHEIMQIPSDSHIFLIEGGGRGGGGAWEMSWDAVGHVKIQKEEW
jgi:hypothetical protein